MARWALPLLLLLQPPVARSTASDGYVRANSTATADGDRRRLFSFSSSSSSSARKCDAGAKTNPLYKRYFDGMNSIYPGHAAEGTCLPVHQACGWPAVGKKDLPTFVISVGLEGAGHHLWTEILNDPVFDCVWTNARHYRRDVADGVPRMTPQELMAGIREQLKLRVADGKPACRKIYDAEDSFPTGALRKTGRIFCRPDLVNIQMLDGVLFHAKYLVIARNVTDTALSALRRNFFSEVDSELRTVEHTLSYMESALRGVPCDRMFIAHYEQALADPMAFIEPLAAFLELAPPAKDTLKTRLSKKGKLPPRKVHKLTQFRQCKGNSVQGSAEACSQKISRMLDTFFRDRAYMWPTFAGNGYDFKYEPM